MLNIDLYVWDIYLVFFDCQNNRITFCRVGNNFPSKVITNVPDYVLDDLRQKSFGMLFCYKDDIYTVYTESYFYKFKTFGRVFHSVEIKKYLFDTKFNFIYHYEKNQIKEEE